MKDQYPQFGVPAGTKAEKDHGFCSGSALNSVSSSGCQTSSQVNALNPHRTENYIQNSLSFQSGHHWHCLSGSGTVTEEKCPVTDLLQTSGLCSDNQLFSVGSCSIHDFDPHGVGRESVAGVQLTSWGDHQLVVAALDVGQPVLARYRHSRRLSVEHGQDS